MRNMNKICNKMAAMVLVAMLLPVVTACQKDDDSASDQKSEYLKPGTVERPVWEKATDVYNVYAQTMSLQVTVQEELLPYISEQDMVRVTSNQETREVSAPFWVQGEWLFPLVIAGDANDGYLGLEYYCAKLKRIYSIDMWMTFRQNMLPTTDGGRPYTVSFF